jgi:chromosomal replication initiator protein
MSAFRARPIQSVSNPSTQMQAGESKMTWSRVVSRLRTEFGDHGYDSWFARLELENLNGEVAYCTVPTKFLKSWIVSQFYDRLLNCVSSEFTDVKHVNLEVRTPARVIPLGSASSSEVQDSQQKPGIAQLRNPPSEPDQVITPLVPSGRIDRRVAHDDEQAGALHGSPLDPRYTFDAFLRGPSNQLAHAAAMSAATAQPDGSFAYNPLYFHAAVGLGKTHLLQAIAHRVRDNGQRAIYLTAEKFMYGFVSSLKAQTSIVFKEKLRSIDVLIIDDVQFLRGESIQQEFGHTLNSLIDAGKRVIVAADLPPAELESLNERIRSRLSGGLCIEIAPFDDALRRALVVSRVEAVREKHPGFQLAPTIIDYVANVIRTNGRDLDGAVNRLVAHAIFAGTKLTIETAEIAIKDLIRVRDPRRVKIDDILKLVSVHYNVSRPDILSSRRTAAVVKPRQIAMYLSKVLTLRSLPEIGRRFGGRDHTTVLHAVRKIEALSRSDKTLGEELELLKRMLSE